jgi:ABC-2 type transport system permease protein
MNFWRISCNDLLILRRDRRSFVILVALPMVFITIIGLSTGRVLGWQNQNDQLSIAVVDEGQGPVSRPNVER